MYNPKYIYIEGSRRTYKLTPEGEQMFRSRFPITPAKDIAHELGCGIDMVYKLANSYEVKKDPTYKRETLRRIMLHARTYYVKDKEANPELYQERFQERGRRICRQRRMDELRIMSGQEPRHNFYFAPAHSKKTRKIRQTLSLLGYIPYTQSRSMLWYFAPETRRNLRTERRAKEYGFKFSCFR